MAEEAVLWMFLGSGFAVYLAVCVVDAWRYRERMAKQAQRTNGLKLFDRRVSLRGSGQGGGEPLPAGSPRVPGAGAGAGGEESSGSGQVLYPVDVQDDVVDAGVMQSVYALTRRGTPR